MGSYIRAYIIVHDDPGWRESDSRDIRHSPIFRLSRVPLLCVPVTSNRETRSRLDSGRYISPPRYLRESYKAELTATLHASLSLKVLRC